MKQYDNIYGLGSVSLDGNFSYLILQLAHGARGKCLIKREKRLGQLQILYFVSIIFTNNISNGQKWMRVFYSARSNMEKQIFKEPTIIHFSQY